MQGFRSSSGAHGPQHYGANASGPLAQGQRGPASGQLAPDDALRNVYAQAGAILQRLRELEAALATQEWWLLARMLPEAQILSELSSLLSVARSELEDFLAHLTGKANIARGTDDEEARTPNLQPRDPQWLYAQREQADSILRYLTAMLPSLHHQAEALRATAGALRLAPALLDPLAAVAERLRDAGEALSPGSGR